MWHFLSLTFNRLEDVTVHHITRIIILIGPIGLGGGEVG